MFIAAQLSLNQLEMQRPYKRTKTHSSKRLRHQNGIVFSIKEEMEKPEYVRKSLRKGFKKTEITSVAIQRPSQATFSLSALLQVNHPKIHHTHVSAQVSIILITIGNVQKIKLELKVVTDRRCCSKRSFYMLINQLPFFLTRCKQASGS